MLSVSILSEVPVNVVGAGLESSGQFAVAALIGLVAAPTWVEVPAACLGAQQQSGKSCDFRCFFLTK